MFVHQSHLRHLLRPDQYSSAAQHRAELRHLFAPAWHPVGVAGEVGRPGDFRTFDLLGTPVLLRNCDGDLRAFLNVCPHRHSKLTAAAAGSADKLRCQYHGWEYTADGRTGRVPDARAFRPWDRENACLTRFRVGRCGEIVFVCLSDAAPPLREFIGPLWDAWAAGFGPPYRFAASWERDFPCNWKVVVENSLESYHVPQVHPTTFKEYPDEGNCWHDLAPQYSTFRTMIPADLPSRSQTWIARRLGGPTTREYWHHALHPHVTYSSLDVHRMLMVVYPTSPTTCRYRNTVFTLRGFGANPFAWGLATFLKAIVCHVGRKVFAEDGGIYAAVQEGLAASPHRGVIGTREERIFAFQEYVTRAAGGSGGVELPMAEAVAGG